MKYLTQQGGGRRPEKHFIGLYKVHIHLQIQHALYVLFHNVYRWINGWTDGWISRTEMFIVWIWQFAAFCRPLIKPLKKVANYQGHLSPFVYISHLNYGKSTKPKSNLRDFSMINDCCNSLFHTRLGLLSQGRQWNHNNNVFLT